MQISMLTTTHQVPVSCYVQEAALMNGSPLRQHQSNSSRGQSSNRAPPDRSTVLYTRMIRMAAAIQQVSTAPGAAGLLLCA